MSKWAEVTLTIVKTFAVEVEDDEELDIADQVASDESGIGVIANIESRFAGSDDEAESIRRHADDVISL